MRSIFVVTLGFLILISCGYRSKFYKNRNSEIRFGCGGGFTGETEGFIINGQGELFRYTVLSKENKLVDTIENAELKKLDRMISEKGFFQIQEDETSNMTCFITIIGVQKKGNTEKHFKWPMEKSPVNTRIVELNKYLLSLKEKYYKP